MRAILLAAIAIGCGAAAPAPIMPLHDHYVLLQREYFDEAAKPYGFTLCGVSYAHLKGTADPTETESVVESQFQNPSNDTWQTAQRSQKFFAGGNWKAAVDAAVTASAPYQQGALSLGSCPVAATVRTILVNYSDDSPRGLTVLAVRCETASGDVTGATTAASTYLSQLMRGAVPTCAAVDGADFATMPIPGE